MDEYQTLRKHGILFPVVTFRGMKHARICSNTHSRVLTALLLITACFGCAKSQNVTILSPKLDIGQLVTCFYAFESLYCGPQSVKPEDADRINKIVDKAVFSIRSIEAVRSDIEKTWESGVYNVRFSKDPADYSLWTCEKTGRSDPAVTCNLLKFSDSKRVAKQLDAARFEDTVLRPLTPESLTSLCGTPKARKQDDISKTYVYQSTHEGTLVEIRFSTVYKLSLDEVSTVDPRGKFQVNGFIWTPSDTEDPNSDDEANIVQIRQYLPCLH